MKNKLLRLAELIQEGFPQDLMDAFKSDQRGALEERLAITSAAIAFHQKRSETLWIQAGKKLTAQERHAAAKAQLAAFIFAYLTGDAKEYADSAVEALQALGRQAEVDLVRSLSR